LNQNRRLSPAFLAALVPLFLQEAGIHANLRDVTEYCVNIRTNILLSSSASVIKNSFISARSSKIHSGE
jgi:hypothetical protein